MFKSHSHDVVVRLAHCLEQDVPRDEKAFVELANRRAKLLASILTINEIAEFSWAKEIRGAK